MGIDRAEIDKLRVSSKKLVAKHGAQARKVLDGARALVGELIESDEAKVMREQLREVGITV